MSSVYFVFLFFFFFQAEDGIRDLTVTGVQTCALPISLGLQRARRGSRTGRSRSRPDGPRRADAGHRGSLRLRRRDLHRVTGAALRRVGVSVRMGPLVGPLVPRVLVRAEAGCRLAVRHAVLRSTGVAPLIASRAQKTGE